ncbi:multicopper oxidase domain-containing protein [Paraburkholderia sp. MPAMCS5]|uniref:multicopper oxidase domain-containing protein n=1 Tax=Paraburkholderia sp. MPAMCS5 TaxID=3112563 RepID=UPI003FA77AF1
MSTAETGRRDGHRRHGLEGVSGRAQPHIAPGRIFVYEFQLEQHGGFMYHPHADGMMPMAIVSLEWKARASSGYCRLQDSQSGFTSAAMALL